MNILPKIHAISAFHEHVQTLKRAGIDEDAIAEISGCENSAVFHDLCSVSSAAIDVIKVCDEEDIHTLELKTLYHYLTQIGFQHGIKSLRKTLNDAENYAKRIETYITDQEVCNET